MIRIGKLNCVIIKKNRFGFGKSQPMLKFA